MFSLLNDLDLSKHSICIYLLYALTFYTSTHSLNKTIHPINIVILCAQTFHMNSKRQAKAQPAGTSQFFTKTKISRFGIANQ